MVRDLEIPAPPPVVAPDDGYRSWKKKSKEKNRLLFTRMGRSDQTAEPSPYMRELWKDYITMVRQQML